MSQGAQNNVVRPGASLWAFFIGLLWLYRQRKFLGKQTSKWSVKARGGRDGSRDKSCLSGVLHEAGEERGPGSTGEPPLTFFTLQGHPGLQVVHLHLQPLESEVIFSRLPLVGNEDDDDNDEQEAAARCDADDGWQGQQAVRDDAHRAGREHHPAHVDLCTANTQTPSNPGLPWDPYCFRKDMRDHSHTVQFGYKTTSCLSSACLCSQLPPILIQDVEVWRHGGRVRKSLSS